MGRKRRTSGSDVARTIAHFFHKDFCISSRSRLRLVTTALQKKKKKKYIYIYIYILYIRQNNHLAIESVVNMCTYSV